MNEFIKDLGLLINAMLIATPPLLYAALGSCISERSGVVNIGIEGMMTVGAFTGAALCYFVPGAPWLAFVLAGVAGALVAVIHAFACITCNADQTISGTAINFLAPGIAIFICRVLFSDSTDTPAITDSASRLPKLLDGVFPAGSFWNNVLNIQTRAVDHAHPRDVPLQKAAGDELAQRLLLKAGHGAGKIWRYLPWRTFCDKYNADRRASLCRRNTGYCPFLRRKFCEIRPTSRHLFSLKRNRRKLFPSS